MRFAAVRTAGRSVRGLHITAITAAVRTQPLPAPFVTAARRVDALTEVVITVETDEGFSGCCGVATRPARPCMRRSASSRRCWSGVS